MQKILEFLAKDGAFLYIKHDCRIVDSEYVATFGGTGSVTLRNDIIEVRFELERDRLFMHMRAAGRRSLRPWFSMDILRQLLTGTAADKEIMNHKNVAFLRKNFDGLQRLFSKPNLEATESAGKELQRQRAKRLFG